MKLLILSLLLMSAGCAEVGLYNAKSDCHGHTVRNTPAGYPCECCMQGE